jgi:hypothetical protein
MTSLFDSHVALFSASLRESDFELLSASLREELEESERFCSILVFVVGREAEFLFISSTLLLNSISSFFLTSDNSSKCVCK